MLSTIILMRSSSLSFFALKKVCIIDCLIEFHLVEFIFIKDRRDEQKEIV